MAANQTESETADIPPWKKHLIARLRAQNKCTSHANGNSISVVTVSTSSRQLPPPLQSESSGRVPKRNNQTSAGIRPSSLTCNQLSATSSAAKSATNPSFSGKDGRSALSNNKFVSSVTRRGKSLNMVQERAWTLYYTSCESAEMVSENDNYSRTSDSDSSEEIHYGPGIVNKLKNKYLSLALRRENYTKQRPSILNLRKATSLENMLDEDDDDEESAKPESRQHRLFQTNGTDKNSTNRYRNSKRGTQDLKRARSVEVVSRFENMISPPPRVENERPKSLHEYILISDVKEGNDKPYRKPKDNKVVEIETNIENNLFSNNYVPRLNRPKRIAPVMNEREKPPADVVKQAKMIFEKRPEQRTKPRVHTGEVAAKVASYKNIIVQSKPIKKPPIKTKPAVVSERVTKNIKPRLVSNGKKCVVEEKKPELKPNLEISKKIPNPSEKIPPTITPRIREPSKDGGKTSAKGKQKMVEEKTVPQVRKKDVDQIVVQLPSPIPDVSIIEFTKSEKDLTGRLCETPDLIMSTSPTAVSTPICDKNLTEVVQNKTPPPTSSNETEESIDGNFLECVSPNYCESNREHLSAIKTSSNENISFNEPLKLIINCNQSRGSPSPETSPNIAQVSQIPPLSRQKIVSPPIRLPKESTLRDRVTEKNLINAAKSLEKSNSAGCAKVGKPDEKTDILVPKKVRRPPREPESNSIVFKFTDRKDVPDYVQNDKSWTVGRLEKPKVGEGGIILLPGALDETFTDEDEEIMRYLQAPPSPCDVTFINDNILIDGKSSINQKTKKSRMKISFVESGPDVYEYPSESSLCIDEVLSPVSATATAQLAGNTLMLSGSSLANYTPKSTEEFQPGVTRSVTNVPLPDLSPMKHLPEDVDQPIFEEVEQPITFSSGTNSDMLF